MFVQLKPRLHTKKAIKEDYGFIIYGTLSSNQVKNVIWWEGGGWDWGVSRWYVM